ncbi:glycosyltransferase family 4 protein [Caulobacter sp. S45]|uniref:glycosyltransferase family 4 protein n=1 Tax=Caulobacter sp. S45 TaxID=1641861 RepID=UPI001576D741|nr:glycosyltransferase family 4 protein [Caulobacter sp. S45]
MRVALIASGFADYSVELAGALAEAGPVMVFADAGALDRERGQAPCPPGVAVRRFSQAGVLRRWASVGPLAAALARWRPDAIVAHEHPHPHLSTLLGLAARIAPLGLIVHDPEPHPGRDAEFARRRAHGIAVQRAVADHLFAHGRACAARLEQATGRPVTPLAHGPILRPGAPPQAPSGCGGVLMFGRMERYKGLEVLLEAGRMLQQRGVAFSLDIRGAGPELDRLHGDVLALPACAVTPGHASRADLLRALTACDVVAAPYLQASASGVAAAALAHGRAVVASAVGGLAEVVRPGVNGVLVPAGDPHALAEGLRLALADCRRLGRGSLRLAEGVFAWRHAAQAIRGAFQDAGRGRTAA